ncbi:MAG: hypothetical protein WA913_12785, partial [Pricia sp.]
METNTKEQIKNRMIKTAALLWKVQANEIERSFDPLVSLLMAACASEIEKVAGEIDNSQTRITEKVVQLITPEAANGPSLAHGILYAEPTADLIRIKPEHLFIYRKEKIYNKTSVKYQNIHFSPVGDFNLVNAKLKYLASGDRFVDMEENRDAPLSQKQLRHSKLDASTLYLGISSDLKSIPIQDISLYFELTEVGQEELFYHRLRNTR